MRHLAVCCDGTWNTAEQEHGGVPTPTNVVRLHHSLAEDAEQLRYYHPGVGTGPGVVERLRGGGLGVGLARNIKSAYSWLATTYKPGDAICLFGFSRGAYTVRSLAGMLSTCGLITFPAVWSPAERWAEVDRLYDEVYRPAKGGPPSGPPPHPRVPIRFLGVWDTVGALGIPDTLGVLNLLDLDQRHRFHDTRLNSLVQHARHAVALDETRGPFTPTLWTGGPAAPEPERSVRQVWFPGNHGDVGGGHLQTGLADGALKWMIEEAAVCTGLRFRAEMLEQIRPDATDVLHDNCTGFYQRLSPTPRPAPLIDEQHSAEEVHASAFARRSRPPITLGVYRPSRQLAVGESTGFEVYAAKPWNASDLYLGRGRYSFQADGEWLHHNVPVGPAGSRDGRFHPSEVLDLAGSFVGWWQERFREETGNDAATFFGARRAGGQWMALTGVVAAPEIDPDGALGPYQPFVIGAGCEHRVDSPGYFYAYANDAWGFYDHNNGSVRLVINRLE